MRYLLPLLLMACAGTSPDEGLPECTQRFEVACHIPGVACSECVSTDTTDHVWIECDDGQLFGPDWEWAPVRDAYADACMLANDTDGR